MKSISRPSHDEKIIELLKRLGTLKAEYPADLLAARRAAFTVQIEERRAAGEHRQESQSQDKIIQLLEGLKPVSVEYPPDLLAARRAAFVAQIEQYNHSEAKAEEQVIELIQTLKPGAAEYPPDLLAKRRAAFIAQIEERNRVAVNEEQPSEEQVIELIQTLKPGVAEYPPELLAKRRTAFIAQIERYNQTVPQEELSPSQNGMILQLLERLKSIEIEYPLKLWNARRSAVLSQLRDGRTSVLDALRTGIRDFFHRPIAPIGGMRRTSIVIATLLVIVFMGSLVYGNRNPLVDLGNPASQPGVSHPSQVAAVTSTGEVAEVICKPGYLPPLCLAQEFDKSSDLTFSGNGSARPAVAKDTIPGYSRIHKAAYINDGLYGPGASWISHSAYSWIKIDLGEVRTINTITFGRDRLGQFNDGDPGQFVIAVALSDNVYADGNSSLDYMEYSQVYHSEQDGFDGVVSGPETIEATFDPVPARYVKITFENAGTAVDEVEAFMIQPPDIASVFTQRPRDTAVPPTFTPIPTNTLVPSRTPTRIPTRTPLPTSTATPRPTFTPIPTDTEIPTDTPIPPTDTEVPTDTSIPPTDTEVPPTDTPLPPPTDTPELIVASPEPQPFPSMSPEAPGP